MIIITLPAKRERVCGEGMDSDQGCTGLASSYSESDWPADSAGRPAAAAAAAAAARALQYSPPLSEAATAAAAAEE